jgi:glutathione S-transferase
MPFINTQKEIKTDSTFIIEYLLQQHQLKDLDLTDGKKRAQAQMLRSMIEEHLYFCLLHSRWVEEKNYQVLKKDFKKLFPPFLGEVSLFMIRKELLKQARAQGISRHSISEVHSISDKLIQTLAQSLDEQLYILGRRCYLDATVYAFLITILKQPFVSHLKLSLMNHENLVSYARRMGQELGFDSLQ